jgi:hypothetical protein
MDVSTQQSPLLHLEVLYRGLSFTWVCLHYRVLATPGLALQGPELHLGLSTLQSPLLHLDVLCRGLSFTRARLHHRVLCFTWTCSTWALVSPGLVSLLHLDMFYRGPELHQGLSTLQSPLLRLDVLCRGLSFT